jgi:hypothetical protein
VGVSGGVRRLGLAPSLSATLLAKIREVNGTGSSGGAREMEIFGMTEFIVEIKSECKKERKRNGRPAPVQGD